MQFEEAFDLGVDDGHEQVAVGDHLALARAEPVIPQHALLVANEDLLARWVAVDVLDGRRAFELRQACLDPERRDGSADEAGLAVGAQGGDDSHRIARGKEPSRVGREVQRDSARPIPAEVEVAVDAAVADGGNSHRGDRTLARREVT